MFVVHAHSELSNNTQVAVNTFSSQDTTTGDEDVFIMATAIYIWNSPAMETHHTDFAGPFLGKSFLVLVDAHSKWPEVSTSRSAAKTISILFVVYSHPIIIWTT